jgi:hypothetical protein
LPSMALNLVPPNFLLLTSLIDTYCHAWPMNHLIST